LFDFVSAMRRPGVVVLLVGLVAVWVSCGQAGLVDGQVGPTGGELCLPDKKVCINFPSGALEDQEIIRISAGAEVPGGALSEGYDIGPSNLRPLKLAKPATVSFSLDIVNADGIENENLLRVYSKEEGADWQPLDKAFVDRVRNVVTGETSHLSPFVVMRSDRLSDGGLPIEIDGGTRDGSVIVVPPFDGGRPDAGRPDAGVPDSGTPDSGVSDAGTPDSGTTDAGTADSGTPDAGPRDAGPPDAGPPDAGPPDAGLPDAGPPDAGPPDAGPPDAGEADAGDDAGVDAG
jgi:hypothetical protein